MQTPCTPNERFPRSFLRKIRRLPIPSLALRGHAPHRASRKGAPCASLFCSPKAGFSNPRIDASQRTAAFTSSPLRVRSLVPAFRSPAATAPLRTSASGSTFPTWYFALTPAVFLARSPFRSTSATGSPRLRMASLLQARCVSNCRRLRLAPQLALPFRDFAPSGSKRSVASAAFRTALRVRPISSHSPQQLSLSSAYCHGSSFLVRFVLAGLLFHETHGDNTYHYYETSRR